MRLTIGENEGAILSVLQSGEVQHSTLKELVPEISAGALGSTLSRMVEKGWCSAVELPLEEPTPVRSTYRLYSLSPLGERALQAWKHYVEG